jgi:predicted dehydrogenase
MKKIKLGVIGAGYSGKTHISNILNGSCPEVEVTAVADTHDANLQWAKENIGSSVSVFKNTDDFFESGRMEAVLVAVPHYDHPKLAIEAFRRGLMF